MKFNVLRDLTNKKFTSSIVRQFVQNDPDDITEAALENDFGAVQVETGAIFEGFINKDATTGAFSVSLTGTVGAGTIALKFGMASNILPLTNTSNISFVCDGTLESPITFDPSTEISALKVAELKCELFEKVMQDRIVKAVDDWKANTTTFENNTPADTFTVSLQ